MMEVDERSVEICQGGTLWALSYIRWKAALSTAQVAEKCNALQCWCIAMMRWWKANALRPIKTWSEVSDTVYHYHFKVHH